MALDEQSEAVLGAYADVEEQPVEAAILDLWGPIPDGCPTPNDSTTWSSGMPRASPDGSSPSTSPSSTTRALTLAIGGRNEERLEALAADLTAGAEWDDAPILLGDAADPESLREMAASTAVVCTTVGPYTTYGTPLVEACIDARTDYCDLTGEVNWIRETVDRFHDAAVEAETRLVHSCGFDSVPADIGTALVQSFARETFGVPCEAARIYAEDGSGGVSGGTLASFGELFEAAAEDPVARRALANPYSLAPLGERKDVDPGEQRWPRKDPLRDEWTAPSPMGLINERIVRRSNALLGTPGVGSSTVRRSFSPGAASGVRRRRGRSQGVWSCSRR